MNEKTYDVVIVGGGVAGLTAGLFAARYGLKTALLERLMAGGLICNAELIENFPGFPNGVPGAELGPLIQEQAMKFGMAMEMAEVSAIKPREHHWEVETFEGSFLAKAVIIAGGSRLKRLGVPGEAEFDGRGVSYCATCDGAFFADQVVAVVGGGDSALDEALTLTHFASKVLLLHKGDAMKGQQVLQDSVLSNPKVEVISNVVVEKILGKEQVNAVAVKNSKAGKASQLSVSGVFIFVGLEPNTEYLKGLLPLDNGGHIPTNIWMETPVKGIFAAGDIRQNSASQLATSAGDGATAAIAAYRYIRSKRWD